MKTPGVSVSSSVVASGELRLTASVVATLVGSGTAAPPGGGVGGLKASPLVVLTLLVEFKIDSVAALVALRHKKINICASKQDCRPFIFFCSMRHGVVIRVRLTS